MANTNPVKIHFINHACVLFETKWVHLLCDPWLSGSVFHEGWDLMVDHCKQIPDLAPTHLWISHEHPDHFSPRDLAKIPPSTRNSLPVYYQQTADKKVVNFLEQQGFIVHELKDFELVQVAENVSLICGRIESDL